MNPSTSRFTLDLQETQSQVSVPAKKGDTGRAWHISVSDGGLPYVFERGVIAKLSILTPTGETQESMDCKIDLSRNIIICDFTEMYELFGAVTSIPGVHSCLITLIDGFDDNAPRLGTAAFTLVVHDVGVIVEINLTDVALQKLKEIEDAETTRRGNEIIRQDNEVRREARFAEYFLTLPRVVDITLDHTKWEGSDDYYYQVVEIEGVTANTKVDLQASADVLAIFHEKDIAFVAENEGGTVTVYVIGDMPSQDYTIQAALKEVIA